MLSFCSWHMCDCFHLVPSWNKPEQTLSLQNRLISFPAGRHDPEPCFIFIRLQFMHILVLLFLLLKLGRSFSIQLYLCSRPTTPPPMHVCPSVISRSTSKTMADRPMVTGQLIGSYSGDPSPTPYEATTTHSPNCNLTTPFKFCIKVIWRFGNTFSQSELQIDGTNWKTRIGFMDQFSQILKSLDAKLSLCPNQCLN